MSLYLDVASALLAGSLVGHLFHMAIHRRWAGPLYRAHMDHHIKQYPPSRLVSDKYLAAKWYNSGALLFTPPLLAVMALALWLGASWVFCGVLIAFAVSNDWLHDQFHCNRPWLERSAWYRQMRVQHFQHHWNMKTNYGIVTNFWDAIFGSKVP